MREPLNSTDSFIIDQPLANLSTGFELSSAVLENVQAGVVACDANGVLILFNRTARDFHGLPAEQIPAEQWAEHYELYHPDGKTRMRTEEVPLFRALTEGSVSNAEVVIAPKAGGPIRRVLASGRAMHDTSGRLAGAVVALHEITALQRSWEELEHRVQERTFELQKSQERLLESEGSFRFLSELGEATRTIADPNQIMSTVARSLGQHMNVSRCAYADVAADANHFTIVDDYTIEGLASSTGDYDLSLFGPRAAADMSSGRTLIVHDVRSELAPDQGADMFLSIGIEALVCCPLVKEGRLVAMMAVHQTTPRRWTDGEVRLVETVVERSWAYIERARSIRELQRSIAAERQHRELLEVTTERLRESEDHYRHTVEMNPQVTWTADADGTLLDLGSRWLDWTGLSREEALDGGWNRATHPDDAVRQREAWARSITTGEPYDVEHRTQRSGGGYRIVRSRAFPRTRRDGKILRWYGTTEDVHARRYAEEQLRGSEERYRFLAESIPQMVWTATPDGRLDYVNERVATYFNTSTENVLGSGWLEWVHPDDQNRVIQQWTEALISEKVYESEFRLLRLEHNTESSRQQSEWRSHLVRAIPFRGQEGRVSQWFGTCTDIEDRKRAEAIRAEHLEREQEALRRHNEDLRQFAYAAAHDLQEPLRTVHSYTQLLERSLAEKLSDHERQFMTYVKESAKRMTRLVRDLQSFIEVSGSDEGLRVGPVRLAKVIDDAVSNLQTAIAETGAQVVSTASHVVVGNEIHLLQLVQNLLSNAIKYRRPGMSPRIEISTEQVAGDIVVAVADNGQGIAPEYQDLVFGLFKRLHGKDVPGTGIGLAICQKIVERNGGKIWVKSDGKEGSTFWFRMKAFEEA